MATVALVGIAVLAILGLIWMRLLIHLGLMQEAAEIEIGPPITCPECGALTPYHTFCVNCGIALRALPRGRRPAEPARPTPSRRQVTRRDRRAVPLRPSRGAEAQGHVDRAVLAIIVIIGAPRARPVPTPAPRTAMHTNCACPATGTVRRAPVDNGGPAPTASSKSRSAARTTPGTDDRYDLDKPGPGVRRRIRPPTGGASRTRMGGGPWASASLTARRCGSP
jgi:hypothetical protein